MSKYISLQKKERKDILKKAVLGMLATGMVAWPSFSPVYAASTITNSSGTSLINTADTVHNIYAQQKVNANIGANKFQTFNVDTNNIANLHFRTTSTSTEHFNTLLNFVDNRININGTVNAISNSKIGGHLFFLSPNGMVVGASGAINTGSLTVIAPTQAGYNRIVNDLSGTNASEHANKLLTAEGVAAVPLNPSGSIVVQGKINAVNNVNLRAGQIYVGTDGTQDTSGNYQNLTEAKIETGVENFSDLVKLTGEQQTAAGLTELTAVRDTATGDISIVADVQLKNASSSTAAAKVVVDGGATVKAAKDAIILAKVENNAEAVEYKDSDGNTKYIVNGETTSTKPDATGGFMADRKNDLQAIVEIGKNSTEDKKVNITAEKDVKINALVENNFATSMLGGGDILGYLTEIPSIILNVFATGDDAVVGFLKSNAEVDIYENSVIKSVAGDIDIFAQAKNKLVLGASVNAFNMMGGINNSMNSFPSLAVTVGSNKTDANIKVDGTVEATAGKVDIEAVGDNTFDSSAAIGTGYGGIAANEACVAIAVNVGWGHNNVKVEIGEHANITANNDLEVRATAKNAISATAKIKSTEKNDAEFTVDVLEYDSFAEADVAGNLTSKNDNLYVTATDDFSKNNLYANDWNNSRKLLNILFEHDAKDKSLLPRFIEPLMRAIAVKLPGEYFNKFATYGFGDTGVPGPGNDIQEKFLDKIKAGVSVGVMEEKNRAVVNIAKTATLKADKKVDLHARVYHHELASRVAGSADVSSTRRDTAPGDLWLMAGGAVSVRNVANTAEVILENRGDGNTANITGDNVSITAQTRIESHNVQSKIDAFQTLFGIPMSETEFKNQFQGQGMDADELDAIWLAYSNYKKLVGAEFFVTDTSGNVVYENGLPKIKPDYQDPDCSKNQELYEKMKTAMEQLKGSVEYKFLSNLLEGKDATYTDSHGVSHTFAGNNSPDSFIGKSKALFSKVVDVVMDVVDAISLENWVDFNVGARASHIYKGEGHNPTFTGDLVVGIDNLSNTANIIIGKNNVIDAKGDINLKTETFLEQSYFDGKLPMIPSFEESISQMNSAYGLKLMVGVRKYDQNSMIVAAENVHLTGKNLTVEADATAKVVGITEYMVTGAATSAVGSLALALPTFVNNNLISFDDEMKLNIAGEVNLTGKNYVNEEIIAGGLVSSGKASGALTVQIFNQQRNNLVVVGDNDDTVALISADEKVPELEWNDYTDKNNSANSKKKDTDEQRVKKLIALNLLADNTFKKKQGNKDVFDRDKAAGLFGTNSTKINNSITAGSFYSKAMNEGEIVTAVADVALSITGGTLDKPDDGPGFFSKLATELAPAGQFIMDWMAPTLFWPIYWPVVGTIKLVELFSGLGDILQGNITSWVPEKPDVPGLEYPADTEVPATSLDDASSVSVDTFRVRTASVIDGVKITLTGAEVTKDSGVYTVYNFSNIASDSTGMVNVAGSAAVGTKGYSSEFTAEFNNAFERGGIFPDEDVENAKLISLSGAAAVGILVNDLTAQVMNSEISSASTIVNEAVREGHLATAAAAVAASLTTTFTGRFKESTNVAAAGGVSLNFGTFSTLASLKDNLVAGNSERPTDLSNIAQTQDIQVTGGIDIDIAKGTSTTVGLGAVVSYAAFANNVTAEIKDDGVNDAEKKRKYTAMGNVENLARTSLTQATMAVGIGVAIKQGDDTDNATVSAQGAAAVNNIANNVFAVNEGITMDAKNLQVMAFDFKKGDISNRLKNWEKSSIDLFRNSTNGSIDEADENITHYSGAAVSTEKLQEKGNLIITGGLELSLALGTSEGDNFAPGAALGISIIDNNFVADVKKSSIILSDAVKYDTTDATKVTSYPARVLAESNTEKWGMVAGANVSRTEGEASWVVGGSILLDFINNDVIAIAEESNITTDGLCLDAYNKEKYVNGTGYFGLATGGEDSGSVGVGLGIVYNKTLNNTAARLLNTDVSAKTDAGSVIGLYANSDTDIYAFAFGGGVSNFGLTANVAVNVGQTNVEAVGTSDGKVKIEGTIEGKNVSLYSEKATADIEFDKIKVEEKLILAGNNWDLDMSNIQTDSDLFDLYVYGAIGADGTVNPTGTIKIDYRNIPGGEKKDVRIRQLNVVNAEIYTDGTLTIDNLSVANRAEINVMGTKTNVYGIMQAADADAQFIYYDPGQGSGAALDLSHVYFGYDLASRQNHIDALSADPTIFEKPAYNPDNCPVCAEEEHNASLTAGGGTGTIPGTGIGGTSGNKGRKFEQKTAGKQRYAGVLLMNNFGYKSYAQRFSAEDLMTHLEDIKAVGQFDNYFNIGLNFFDRFNIIDIPDVAVNSITLNNTFRDSGIIVVRDDKKDDEYDF